MAVGNIFIICQQLLDEEEKSRGETCEVLRRFLETPDDVTEEIKKHNLIIVNTSSIALEDSLKTTPNSRWSKVQIERDLTSVYKRLLGNNDTTVGLFGTKRFTLADIGDQLVAVQLSNHDKTASAVDANSSSANDGIWKIYKKLMNNKIECLKTPDYALNCLGKDELSIWEKYDSFCKKCNILDVVDFCNTACNSRDVPLVDVVLFSKNRNEFEMILLECLLHNADNINVVKPIGAIALDIASATKTEAMSVLKTRDKRDASLQSPQSSGRSVARTPSLTRTPVLSRSPGIFYPETPKSCAKNQLRKIILCYLRLLVNTRDEIALARVINAPNRDLHHKAFTDIRKTAHMKGLPMFQTAVSFVRQMSLGGKGYAPAIDCLLSQHIKGLSEFVALMNKLQEIIEDATSASDAFKLILRSLRLAFTKAKVQIFKPETVLDCVEELQQKLSEKLERSVTDQEVAKSTIVEIKIVLALKGLLDEEAISSFHDFENGDRVPCSVLSTPEVSSALVKMPSLNSQFRTPEEVRIETPKRASRKQNVTKPSMDRRSIIGDMRWAVTNPNMEANRFDTFKTREEINSAKRPQEDLLDEIYTIDPSEDDSENIGVMHTKQRILVEQSENTKTEEIKIDVATRSQETETISLPSKRQKLANDKNIKIKNKKAPNNVKSIKRKQKNVAMLAGQRQVTSFFKNAT